MADLRITVPEDLAVAVHLTPDEAAAQIRLMAALKMFELGKLSSGKAAELAGITRVEFLEACGRYQVPVFNYTPEDVERELQSDLETLRESKP